MTYMIQLFSAFRKYKDGASGRNKFSLLFHPFDLYVTDVRVQQ